MTNTPEQSFEKEHIEYHKDGSIWAMGKVIDGVPNGYWEWFRKDGTRLRSGYFELGVQVGEWTTYDRNGNPYKVTIMNLKRNHNHYSRRILKMGSFSESMREYQKQLNEGHIQAAYQGLMEYFRSLKSHFNNKYPEYSTAGGIYYGYMDMTYFALSPESLKQKKLKIAIVFIHEAFQFEVWLSGANRDVQAKYWKLLKGQDWSNYYLSSDPRGEDYILGSLLVRDPDFSDLEALTSQIESGTLDFIKDVEDFFQ